MFHHVVTFAFTDEAHIDEASYRACAVDPLHKQVLAWMVTVVASASVVDWAD